MRLVLASASPRRAELLRAAGFDFDVRAGRRRRAHPARRSAASTTSARLAGDEVGRGRTSWSAAGRRLIIVLGADTAVVVDGRRPRQAARRRRTPARMLRRLSGRDHEVLTGVSLRRGAQEVGERRADDGVDCRRSATERDRLVRRKRGGTRQGGRATPSRGWRRGSSRGSTGRIRTWSGCRSRRHELIRSCGDVGRPCICRVVGLF